MAIQRVVVDTSIIVDYLRRGTATLEQALLQFECAITAVTLYELRAITVRSERQDQLLSRLSSVITVLPFDAQAATLAAEVWRDLAAQGIGIGLPDTLIAGTCLAEGIPLLTRNPEHYRRVTGLRVLTPEDLLGT